MSQRFIMHIDMDAFFASIEQLDHPEWRGRPVIVGGQERGVVSTASYEARKFGVHSAMPAHEARRLCPHGIFVFPNGKRYKMVSRSIRECLQGFSPLVEMASIDEAYLDVTGVERLFGPPEELCRKVKAAIFEVTGGLTCSIGMAPVKFLAKISSEERKPNGIFILYPENMPDFLARLKLSRIPGVGKKFAAHLSEMGMSRGSHALTMSRDFWEKRYGKAGASLYDRLQGIDPREVVPYTPPKSESAETTLAQDTGDKEYLKTWLLRHAERVGTSLRKHGFAGRTVTLKVKFADFQLITRQMSLNTRTDSTDTIYRAACALLDELPLTKKVRLIGLGVSNFQNDQAFQYSLLNSNREPEAEEKKRRQLDKALDSLRSKYGGSAVVRGRLFEEK